MNRNAGIRRIGPIASLLPAFGLAAWAQQAPASHIAQGTPLPEVKVNGLSSLAGAKIVLINAKGEHVVDDTGEHCRDSVVLPLSGQMFDSKAGVLQIGGLVDSGCWCNDPMAGLAVLAPDRAVAYFANQRKRPNLPLSLCVKRDSFTVTLRHPREVDVHVWAPDVRLRSMAKDDIANADWIYNKELAGVTLRPVFNKEKEGLSKLDCESAAASKFYQPGAINVYYGLGIENQTCEGGDIVLIHEVPVLGDAAHELGHALGLFQNDNQNPLKPDGHTTAIQPFACDNVMWTQTQFLKNSLSPGQAFWMSQSCKSFLAFSGTCLTCSPDPGSPSPCPPFSLGGTAATSCNACSVQPSDHLVAPIVEKLRKELGAAGGHAIGDIPTSVFCTRKELIADLYRRYNDLKAYVSHRPELPLGAAGKIDFINHWLPEFQLQTPPPPTRK
jgi:hypothetical protein